MTGYRTTRQVATALGISEELLASMVRRHKLPEPVKFGRAWAWSAEDVDAAVKALATDLRRKEHRQARAVEVVDGR